MFKEGRRAGRKEQHRDRAAAASGPHLEDLRDLHGMARKLFITSLLSLQLFGGLWQAWVRQGGVRRRAAPSISSAAAATASMSFEPTQAT